MSEKNYFGELKSLLKEERKLVISGLAILAILLIILGAWLFQKNSRKEYDGMAEIFTEQLMQEKIPYVPEDRIEEISGTVTEVLNELSAVETDKKVLVQKVKDALVEMNLGLSDPEAEELAAWMVDLYLDHYTEVYGENGKMNHSLQAGHKLMSQMEQDLQSMQEYLNQLDQSVQQNQQELNGLSGTQQDNYQAAYEYLNSMESLVAELQNEFRNYEKQYAGGQNSVTAEFSGIKSELEKMLTQLTDSRGALTESIKNADSSNSSRYEAVKGKVESLQNNLNNNLAEMKNQLNGKINDLQKTGNENDTALAEELSGVQKKITEHLRNSQTELETVLKELEESEAGRILQLTDHVDSRVTELNTHLEQIHSNIAQSQDEIQGMLDQMKIQDTADMKEMMEQFQLISSDVTEINTAINSAHTELKTLILTLQESEDENHAELLTRLSDMDSSFGQQNDENYQTLVSSMQTQSAEFRSALDTLNIALEANVASLQQGVADSKTEMLQKLSAVETNLNTGVAGILGGMSGNQEEVLNRIADIQTGMSSSMAGIQNELQSVFQSVSNGKALLASALLTKNVTINEDAAFQEIYDAILAVPQEIVLGEAQIPGEIEYEYHYHTGDSVNGGGCYTVEDVHQHVGSCYVTCNYTNGGCVAEGNYQVDGWMHCPYSYKHSYCTGGAWKKGEYVHLDDGKSHKGEYSGTHLVVVCGKEEGTHYGWKPGCGLGDGQITGATIRYSPAP